MGLEKLIEKAGVSKAYIPKKAQDVIQVKKIYEDGSFYDAGCYSRTFRLTDIDYTDKTEDEQRYILGKWSELLNSLDGSKATYQITACNRRVNVKKQVEKTFINTDTGDGYDSLRDAYNKLRWEDLKDDGRFIREKYITASVRKNREEQAKTYMDAFGRNLNDKLLEIGSGAEPVSCEERLRIIHDFFRYGCEDEFNFTYSRETAKRFKNYCCPESITFHADYFDVNEKKGRAFMLRTWGDYIPDDFFYSLTDIPVNMFCTMDVIPFSSSDGKAFLENREAAVEGNAYRWSIRPFSKNSAARLPRKIKNDRDAVDAWNEDIYKRGQKVFFCQVVGVILCDSMEQLNEYTETIRATASDKNAAVGVLWGQQLEGLLNAMVFGKRTIENLRDCNTETTAVMLPFSNVLINHENGIPYGRHKITKQQQFVDRRTQANGHEFIFGVSGYGKSLNAKLKMFFEVLLTDGDLVICDPDGEYTPLVSALGGQVVHLGVDGINVMDMPEGYDDRDPLKKKSNFIISLIESILGRDNLGEIEKSIIDRCLRIMYKWKMQDFYEAPVTWNDWYDILCQQEGETAEQLALSLERHITGSFSCFAGQNTVYRDSRIVLYDLSSLPKQMKDAGMHVCLDDIDQRLIRNRYNNRITYVNFDEMDYYFKHRNSIMIIEDFFERARKYNGIIRGMFQDVSKMLSIPEARTMFNNSDNIIMMHQEKIPARELQNLFNLSENQYNYLCSAEPGFGINKIGNIFYSFDGRIPVDNPIYTLVNTDGNRGNR